MSAKKYSMQQENRSDILSEILFWIPFSIFAIWMQKIFSGTDMFLVGLIIALQSKKWKWVVIIAFFSMFVQEGLGIFNFGMILCWYASLAVLFVGGSNFFEVDKIYFVSLLSLLLVAVKIILLLIFSSVQGVNIVLEYLIKDGIIQSLVIPILWMPIYFLRKRFAIYGNTV